MMKLIVLFSLVFSTLGYSTVIDDMFSGKKPSTTKCYDFGKPAKIKKTKGNNRNKRKNKRSRTHTKAQEYKINLCVPELTKQMEKNDASIEKLESKMDKIVSANDVRDRAQKVAKRRNKKKWRLSADCEKFSNTGRKQICLFEKRKKSSMKEERRDRLNSNYIESMLKNFNKITQLERMELVIEYRDYLEVYEPEKLEAFDELDFEKISDSKIFVNKLQSSKFLKVYAQEHLPEYQSLESQVKKLEYENDLLIEQEKHICNKNREELNSCPQVQNTFLSSINADTKIEEIEANFEQMIGMLGGFKYGPKDDSEEQLYVDVTASNYKEFKKIASDKDFITQQRQVDFIESRYDKANEALDNFKYNKENKDKPGFQPKKVASICGGCRDLKIMFEEAKSSQNQLLQVKLFELDQKLGCGVVKETKRSCEEQVGLVLKNSKFNADQGKPYPTIETALSDLKRLPKNYTDSFSSAFDEVLSIVEVNKADGVKACTSCQVIKDKIDVLGAFVEKKSTDALGAQIVQEYFQLKDSQDEAYFSALKNIAVANNCLAADDYKREPENSCTSKTAYFKTFLLENPSMDALSTQKRLEYNEKLAQLREYEQKEKIQCCDEIIGELETIKDINESSFIRDNSQMSLAQALQCMTCGQDKKSDRQVDTERLNTSAVSCGFYKKYIEKASGQDINQLKVDGKPYSVAQFLETEVYTCKNGPGKSIVNPARDWETIAYSKYGKYGAHADLDLQCYIDPTTGESVNLSCCGLKPDSPQFKNLQKILGTSASTSSDFISAKDHFSASDKISDLNKQFGDKKVNTFCREVLGKYEGEASKLDTSSWKICHDNKGREFYKVQSLVGIEKKAESGFTKSTKVLEK